MRWLAMPILAVAVVTGCGENNSSPSSHLRERIEQPDRTDVTARIDEPHKRALVQAIAAEFERNYVYPEPGNRIAESLRSSYQRGDYGDITSPLLLAAALTEDLRKTSADPHIVVYYGNTTATNPLFRTDARLGSERVTGFERVDRLSGNLGYIKIVLFTESQLFERAVDAAMLLLKDTDALIIDLRQSPGGSASSAAYLISYFLGSTQPRLLRTVYLRNGPPGEIWSRAVPGRYVNKPVYVLVSRNTGSAAEMLAFDMKAQHLARVVGEWTSGGAHVPMTVYVDKDFWMQMPVGYTSSPGYKGDWEEAGVAPDVPASAQAALVAAISHYVDRAVPLTTDAAWRRTLQRVKDHALQGGEAAIFSYSPPPPYVPVPRH